MKKTLYLTAITALLLFNLNAIRAEDDGEKILEECITEAHKRGYDIESDAFINRLVDAIENEKEKVVKEICPKTFKKYPD